MRRLNLSLWPDDAQAAAPGPKAVNLSPARCGVIRRAIQDAVGQGLLLESARWEDLNVGDLCAMLLRAAISASETADEGLSGARAWLAGAREPCSPALS